MILKLRRAQIILHSVGLVVLSGSIISATYTTDKRWMDWHFSRLGEGGHLSSLVFNITILIGSVLLYMLGRDLVNQINNMKSNKNINVIYAKSLVMMVFAFNSACLLGVSLFPFDVFPVIHNSFGYGMTLMMLALCLLTPIYLPIYPKWFYSYGYLTLIVAAILFTFFFTLQPYSLLQIEVIVFLMVYIWLIIFVNGICSNTTKVTAKRKVNSVN